MATTALYPKFEKQIGDATAAILRTRIAPWAHLNSGKPLRPAKHDGSLIAYEGVTFDGSPRLVFWSRYIEPFLEDLATQQIEAAASLARERRVDVRGLLTEIEGLLL